MGKISGQSSDGELKIEESRASSPIESGENSSRCCDNVTVFQSAPLVWKDHNGKCHPILSPNFEDEKRYLLEAVREGENNNRTINLFFEPANTDRLVTFLASGQCPVMHFSAHGHPEYLLMEAEGQAQPLFVDRLKAFMAASLHKPKLVFVSACHSQAAGDAFLAAGIDHVVCCPQNEKIRDTAAIVFAQNFYKVLALDNVMLKDAFELAKQAVLNSPLVADAEKEVHKFLLLPEKDKDDDYHRVRIFYQTPVKCLNKHPQRQAKFSPPPALFLGRELTMYDALQALKRSRLLQITGPKGIGKSSFAKAVCDYLFWRCNTFEEIFWLSDEHFVDDDDLSDALQAIHKMVLFEDLSAPSVVELKRLVMKRLRCARALITIDAREFEDREIKRLESVLRLLINGTQHITIMLIASHEISFGSLSGYSCAVIMLQPLGFKDSALLFGTRCRHVSNGHYPRIGSPSEFTELLVPEDEEDATLADTSISKHSFAILTLIGFGLPGSIHAVASSMTEQEYDKLIWMAEQLMKDPISSIVRTDPQEAFKGYLMQLSGRSESVRRILGDRSAQNMKSKLPEHGSSSLASDLKRATEQLPPALQLSEDDVTSSSDGSDGYVGVEFSGTNMDRNLDWNRRIIASKQQIEQNVKKLLRYGNLGYGETELSVEHIIQDGVEKAVARLECEIELHEDLKLKEHSRVRDICHKLAALLREAGATESELEKLMIGCAWRGSLELLLEGPSSCLDLLAMECARADFKLPVDSKTYLVDVAPAFSVKGPVCLVSDHERSEADPDLFVWKRECVRLLCPATEPAREMLFGWGRGGSIWRQEDLQHCGRIPYTAEVMVGLQRSPTMGNSFAENALEGRSRAQSSYRSVARLENSRDDGLVKARARRVVAPTKRPGDTSKKPVMMPAVKPDPSVVQGCSASLGEPDTILGLTRGDISVPSSGEAGLSGSSYDEFNMPVAMMVGDEAEVTLQHQEVAQNHNVAHIEPSGEASPRDPEVTETHSVPSVDLGSPATDTGMSQNDERQHAPTDSKKGNRKSSTKRKGLLKSLFPEPSRRGSDEPNERIQVFFKNLVGHKPNSQPTGSATPPSWSFSPRHIRSSSSGSLSQSSSPRHKRSSSCGSDTISAVGNVPKGHTVLWVTIPYDVLPGEEFEANVGDRAVQVQCPLDSHPGQALPIIVPVDPSTLENNERDKKPQAAPGKQQQRQEEEEEDAY